MSLTIWRKHIWKRVARMLERRDGVPFDVAVRCVRANRGWLAEAWPGWSVYKLWDKLTDAEAENCPEREWPYWREDDTPDIPRALAERYLPLAKVASGADPEP